MPAPPATRTLPPCQTVTGPLGVIVATGNGVTVTVTGALAKLWHPLASFTCTVNVPLAFTVIVRVVSPLLQIGRASCRATSKITLPPCQKVTAPLGVIVAT